MASLRIASPCSEPWGAMLAVEGGRFCDACRRQVHDLTRMTATRAHAYALVFGGSGLCARLRVDGAGQPVFRPDAGSAVAARPRVTLPVFAAAALGAACTKTGVEPAAPAACAPTATIVTLGPEPRPGPVTGAPAGELKATEPSSPAADAPRRVIVTNTGDLQILQFPRFRPARAAIEPVHRPLLDEVAKLLLSNPQIVRLDVEGHADDRERDPDGIGLARANAVVAYLVSRGVSPSILRPRSAGSARPLDDSGSADGRERNRRVEFHIAEP